MHADIERADGTSFRATLANLTGSSVFVKGETALAFRSLVVLRFEGVTLPGEVALVSRDPLGFVVAFAVPAEHRLTFGALIEMVEPLPDASWVERTEPGPTEERAAPQPIIAPLRGAPPMPLPPLLPPIAPPRSASRVSTAPVPPANPSGLPARAPSAVTRSGSQLPAPSITPRPRAPTLPPIQPSLPAAAPSGSSRPSASVTPAPPIAAVARAPSVAPPNPAVPQLGADDRLQFPSARAFMAHYKTQIAFGGIIAQSAPRAIGSMHEITLVIPGVDTLVLRARVGFVGETTVGFMIDSFPVEKPRLEALLARVGAVA